MKFKSIGTELAVIFGALLIVICAGLGIISYTESSGALSSSVDESLTQLAKESAKVVQARAETQLNALAALADTDAIKNDTLTLDEKLRSLEGEVERSGHLRMNIADTNGSAKNTNGELSDISDREYFKKALAGERAVSDPVVSKADNTLIVSYAVPIKDGNTVKGVLIAIREGNELSSITDDIKFGKSGAAFMINKQGTTVANSNRDLVTKMDNNFENVKKDPGLKPFVELEQQMAEGKAGSGEYTYNGVTKYMGFAPVEGTSWSLAVTAPKSEAMEKVSSLLVSLLIISAVFLIAGVAVTFLLALRIARPIKDASEYLDVMATGDFTGTVPQRLLAKKDEIGVLANAVNTMQRSIRNIIKNVAAESSNVSKVLININNQMERLNKNIEGISATTQELSAGTEESASSTEEMNATSTEIEKAVESIAAKAQEGAITVNNESRISQEMKQNAIASRENTVAIYTKSKAGLQNAIEQSKAVGQINELSEAILEITSQTNLLALNAAIEAARAGEAGKGFAVVAEEIRKLAEGSKNSVSRIQEVTKVIFEAVNGLSSSSGELMGFIDKTVLRDYENLVESSEKYSKNSMVINDMVSDFSATSEELLASMQNMVKAIEEIAGSANEEAQGAANIAQETAEITQLSNEVIKMAGSAKGRSESLIKAVSSFKV